MRCGASALPLVSIVILLLLTVNTHISHSKDVKESCSTCKQITDNFAKGFERTAKKNFGGGNTAWEERKLSKYETSEIRLVEILEGLCDTSFECNHMVEEHEDLLETWWFKSIKVCCPNGTFGPDCNACVGGSERPCHGSGVCDGDGTRAGDGTCSCNHGYRGELCLECADGYFSEERNDTFSKCTECHPACLTCHGPTRHHCKVCKAGWEQDEEGVCSGKPGGRICDKACSGCRGQGPEHCLTCADGYSDEDGTCTDVDECEVAEPPCPADHQQCVNSQGSYRCVCAGGFQEQDGVCVESPAQEEHEEGSQSVSTDPLEERRSEQHEDL
ncbi:cysteine-rich with EGF-like domain protein 2 [Arapaima gigas]